jgi:AraC-like DNA-binding protein
MSVIEVLLRGLTAGVMLATCVGFVAADHNGPRSTRPARWSGALFCLSVAAFAVHSGGAETEALGILRAIIWLLAAGGIGYFWLFAITLFDDRRFVWSRLSPTITLTLIAGIAATLPNAAGNAVWIIYYVLATALGLHVLWVVAHSWNGDLVEARRSLRGPFIALVAINGVVLSGLQMSTALGIALMWEGTIQAGVLAAMSLLGAFIFLQARPGLFAQRPRASNPDIADGLTPKDRLLHEKLQTLMNDDDIWRREGLTIGQLATALGTAEHRLRHLINSSLGYRNFAEFLNSRRIAAAKATLADPSLAEVAISTLAFRLGYATLGPFNRAFKEATGTTPSAWRAQALGASSITNIPR